MYGVALRDVWFLFWVFEFDCQEDVQEFVVSCIIFLAFMVFIAIKRDPTVVCFLHQLCDTAGADSEGYDQ